MRPILRTGYYTSNETHMLEFKAVFDYLIININCILYLLEQETCGAGATV